MLQEAVALEEEGKLKKVEKYLPSIEGFLKAALKSDRIRASDLSLALYFLNSFDCKSSTAEHALMRLVQYMHKLSFFEIGLGLQVLADTDTSQKNVHSFLNKVEFYITNTNEKLLPGLNIQGIYMVFWFLDGFKFGSRQLWAKLDSILTSELSKKREPLDKDYILNFMKILAQRNLGNETTWTHLLQDVLLTLNAKVFDLEDVYSLHKALYALGSFEDVKFLNKCVDYLTDKGYDEEDFLKVLGLQKGSKLLYFLLHQNTEIQNNNFLTHA